ncbi:MAG: hypothetical protein IM658_05555 [Phenylobacterium sp.]|uniref:hypothetical protein n=1 Tax=Phenylobacterium sp. TaxID=1871053 RepID=UPI0025CE9CD6|nr:hypothetical protein [Phenylobacterium sp.]MCA3713481.1 hypothetical protein [Phenylobacterium sp.]MCA3724491.1 hypothetical protein [Phenylobacterium sp.]MCA3750067.1 hypothetical protein [Phenylobacterium sp.]MCA6241666.1 hypothetical protein [Phenylobacterium sp.]MCA6255174.1 hypothetical protein [Phenylobacterium sp.]
MPNQVSGLGALTQASISLSSTDAFIAVGRFMYFWSRLEHSIDLAISNITGLIPTEYIAFTSKQGVDGKLGIIKYFENYYVIDGNTRHNLKIFLKKIENIKNFRNSICHSPFIPNDDGTVTIYEIKMSKGRIVNKKNVWDSRKFESMNNEIIELVTQIKTIADVIAIDKSYITKNAGSL